MATTLNYLLEANLALVLILVFYYLFLRKETNFRIMRMYMLVSIIAALLLPLVDIQLNQNAASLSISRVIPTYWLPEVVVGDNTPRSAAASFDVWMYIGLVYVIGLVLGLGTVLFQLIRLAHLIRTSTAYQRHNLRIAESTEQRPTFSFFNFIFIGNAAGLSSQEKEQIILHESVHAAQWHSFDILLINVLKIFFWFNPLVNTYKKIFIQLHEFEADARAVENRDVDKYCSLLARVALQSADYPMANHFNNSLTVKRIEMMRTIKSNIRHWKLAASAAMLPLLFFFVACNDQVGDDVMAITKNSSHALIIPKEVQERFDELKQENPGKNFAVLELNETASQKISDLENQYGLPKSMEVFKVRDGQVVGSAMRGESASGVSLHESENAAEKRAQEDFQTFAILEFTEEAEKISDASAQEDKVFTVVEEQPEYVGGHDKMIAFIFENLKYPADARAQGIEGTVYVSFIVETDGSVTDTKVIKGVAPGLDQEAKRVVDLFPKWEPGKQDGQAVRVKFVMPIKFKLS